jgi:GT2 family glycosyltransferase
MEIHGRKKIVLLGMMTRMPVAGNIWVVGHYLVGFQRLGYDPYYVEAHARTPGAFMEHETDDGSAKAAAFIDRVMRRFDLGDRWAFHALHEDGRCYGMSHTELQRLYQSAELIINLHGGTIPLPEHSATGRLIYLETDPVELEIELHDNNRQTIEFLEPHSAFFTWGGNYGQPDCRVPLSDRFHFHPTRPPVVCDFWENGEAQGGECFTTIGNWRQVGRDVTFQGETYSWSKHHEYLKFIDLPRRVEQAFELALAGFEDPDRQLLESHGWRVRRALDFSSDLDAYRHYIRQSRGEFTVAKDQNVRLRSGWFSERSAQYLAAGRPVITQETGFSNVLPTGEGLFGFSTLDEIVASVEAINSNYSAHCRQAAAVAREYFNYDVVLKPLLAELGVTVVAAKGRHDPAHRGTTSAATTNPTHLIPAKPFTADLDLRTVSRWPTKLPDSTIDAVSEWPAAVAARPWAGDSLPGAAPSISIVILTHDNLTFTKLCLESVVANTEYDDYELVIVDNGSTDGTPDYLREVAEFWGNVRLKLNDYNLGFAAGNNQGLALARGDVLVLLNNDTIVAPGWLTSLVGHLDDPMVGAVGPVTNRIGNEAQVASSYRTYGEFLEFAARYVHAHRGERFEIPMLVMFCLAMRREVFQRIGDLDERFAGAMFEDDDYAMRIRAAGLRLLCAEDAFVHHFGEAAIGKWAMTSEYGERFHANRARWEEKWRRKWVPHRRRLDLTYQDMISRIRQAVASTVPAGATVLVVSKGDDELLELPGRNGRHFPQVDDGTYSGHSPANDQEAIAHLEFLRTTGAAFLVIPATSFWWFEHYRQFHKHLTARYSAALRETDTCLIFSLDDAAPVGVVSDAGYGQELR